MPFEDVRSGQKTCELVRVRGQQNSSEVCSQCCVQCERVGFSLEHLSLTMVVVS